MKKRLASTLLALALCLSLLPTAALAEGETPTQTVTEVDTQDKLVAAVQNDGEVKLTGNIELTNKVTISKTVTLDLNGKTLTSDASNKIESSGNLTITDSTSGGMIAENTILEADLGSVFHMTGNAVNNGTLIITGDAQFTMDGNTKNGGKISLNALTSSNNIIFRGQAEAGTVEINQAQEKAGICVEGSAKIAELNGNNDGIMLTMKDDAEIGKVEKLSFKNPQLSGNAKLGSEDSTFAIVIPKIEGETEPNNFTIQDHVQLYGKVTIVLADNRKEFVLGGNASITGDVTVSNEANAKIIMKDESVIHGDVTCVDGKISFEIQDNAKINGTISSKSSDGTSGNVGDINLIVKFDLNGGDLPAETENSPYVAQTVSLNGKITQPAAPTKSGYRFSGWYCNGSAWNFEEGVTAPMILTAQWSRKSSGGSPSYGITAAETNHGTVALSAQSAKRGSTVTITVKPDSGYVLETLVVVDGNGNEQKLTDLGEGRYTFSMPSGKVEVKATFQEDNSVLNVFYDVPNDAYYFEAVKWAVGKGITNGVSENLFGPDRDCTRAQIVTFLWRAAGSPVVNYVMDLTDVPADAYYAEAVRWALSEGITTGTSAGKFSPDAACTRAQAVTFLARALDGRTEGAANFQDVPAGSYYAEAVAWALETGVTNGISETLFGPDQACTRGQIVTFLFRADAGK